jgi:hypothetical protein
MAAKRAPSKRTKSKPRRVIQTVMEPMVQNRDSAPRVEAGESVVVEATTVSAVERQAPDTVVVERESIQSAPSGALDQGAVGHAAP